MTYTVAQWLLMFFTYCFFGWCWESGYVSLKQRAWVNRGFLYGPWLPIYGSGAILVLFLTLPVRDQLPWVYLIGMVGASLLEYVTGAVMERLFHMRYWDYSEQPFNLHGHICLLVSFVWGLFSVALIKFLHPPVERVILMVPTQLGELLAVCLTVLFTVDTVKSVQAALDLKELMHKLAENSQTMERINAQLSETIEQLNEDSELLHQRLANLEESLAERHERLAQNRQARRQSRNAYLLEQLQERRDRKSERLTVLLKKSELALEETSRQLVQADTNIKRERLEATRTAILEFQTALHKMEVEMSARKDREFQRAVSILYRNPTAISRKYHESLTQLNNLNRNRKNKN